MRLDVFFDSNVILYNFSADAAKAARSEELLSDGGVVSVQVLNECAFVALRKMKKPWPEVRSILGTIRESCAIAPLTVETHLRGLALAERYQFQVYDGMIVAAALLAGCTTLYTEDMHDGLVIDALTIRNPYKS